MKAVRFGVFALVSYVIWQGGGGLAFAVTHHVDINSPGPSAPYLGWGTAATSIQDAVNEAAPGDTVLVADGDYDTNGPLTSGRRARVVITNDIRVVSVNGPDVTRIIGTRGDPGDITDDIRCVYMLSGATMVGFTLTNGSAAVEWAADGDGVGGGAYLRDHVGVFSNCVFTGCNASEIGGGANGGEYYQCRFVDNTAQGGGGAGNARLFDCVLERNRAVNGGAALTCTLVDCTVSNNWADNGAGVHSSFLTNCVVVLNSAEVDGGGMFGGTAYRSTMDLNDATDGGGAYGGVLKSCLLTANTATNRGGGIYYVGSVLNCTVADNFAAEGGGIYIEEACSSVTIRNNIFYYNQASVAGDNYEDDTAAGVFQGYDCCLTPAASASSITDPPLFVDRPGDDYRPAAGSPCRDTGYNYHAGGDQDRDGRDRILNGTVDIGAYESTGALHAASIMLSPDTLTFSTPAGIAPADQSLAVRNGGQGTLDYTVGEDAAWLAVTPAGGTSTGETDTLVASVDPGSLAEGSYTGTVTVTDAQADNSPQTAEVMLHVIEEGGEPDPPEPPPGTPATHYVNIANTTPQSPYTNWTMAAVSIQDAADVAVDGSTVWVADGVYDTGSRLPPSVDTELACRVVITNALTIRSLNGPDTTHIVGAAAPGGGNGAGAIRCVYLATNASLTGFTIRNGHTLSVKGLLDPEYDYFGGGIISDEYALDRVGMYGDGGSVTNCILTDNSSKHEGGGTWGVNCHNCLFVGNTSTSGGGAAHGSVNNCTVADNVTSWGGGGTHGCDILNSIVYHNMANGIPNANISNPLGANRTNEYTCTTVFPLGSHNVIDPPRFYDRPLGDYRLAPDSPCIGAGLNAHAMGDVDLDEAPRIQDGTVDMGAYEFGGVDAWVSVSTTGLNPSEIEGNNPPDDTFTVGNLGTGDVIYTVSGDVPWLTVNPAWGTSSGEQDAITVGYDTLGLPNGVYTGAVTVWSTQAPESSRTIPVVLTLNQGIYYVDVNNPTPAEPYNSWAKAANTIQEAVDLAASGARVIVADGVYEIGGKSYFNGAYWAHTTNRVTMVNNVTVESVNGAAHTTIRGAEATGGGCGPNAVRCVFMKAGALRGFTLQGGHTVSAPFAVEDRHGGGLAVTFPNSDPVVEDCVLTGNRAADQGGGAFRGTLLHSVIRDNHAEGLGGGGAAGAVAEDCLVLDNSTAGDGGGLYSCTAKSCTIVDNTATNGGGGISGGSFNNCIIYYNYAATDPNWKTYNTFTLWNICTTPLPAPGQNCITNPPAFADMDNDNYRLSYQSPCRDIGNNFRVNSAFDLDGNERIQNATVDLGCYEYDPDDAPVIPDAWWTGYGVSPPQPVDGDLDLDGRPNYLEYIADTHPNDINEFFPDSIITKGPSASTVTIDVNPSSPDRLYDIIWKADLADGNPWQSFGIAVPGNGGLLRLTVVATQPHGGYAASVRLP